eukprot:3473659-Pyramimonas_sp.AAC.1
MFGPVGRTLGRRFDRGLGHVPARRSFPEDVQGVVERAVVDRVASCVERRWEGAAFLVGCTFCVVGRRRRGRWPGL